MIEHQCPSSSLLEMANRNDVKNTWKSPLTFWHVCLIFLHQSGDLPYGQVPNGPNSWQSGWTYAKIHVNCPKKAQWFVNKMSLQVMPLPPSRLWYSLIISHWHDPLFDPSFWQWFLTRLPGCLKTDSQQPSQDETNCDSHWWTVYCHFGCSWFASKPDLQD